jgi:hypothetical protein
MAYALRSALAINALAVLINGYQLLSGIDPRIKLVFVIVNTACATGLAVYARSRRPAQQVARGQEAQARPHGQARAPWAT